MSCGENLHSLWFHIPVGSCITIACLLGNVPLLWIYARNKQTLKKKLFEVSFAVVDIVACTLQVHTFPSLSGRLNNILCDNAPAINRVHAAIASLCIIAYSSLCLAFAIDRFWGVFFPIGYSNKRPRVVKNLIIACSLFSVIFVLETNCRVMNHLQFPKMFRRLVRFGLLFMILVATVLLYIVIVIKLWKMGKVRTNRIAPTVNTLEVQNDARHLNRYVT